MNFLQALNLFTINALLVRINIKNIVSYGEFVYFWL